VEDEDAAAEVPHVFILFQSAPNPFNPSTVIRFGLASDMPVRLAVYSASGQKVRELASGRMNAGKHSVVWDGRNDAGQTVSSGVYLYRLEAGGRSETKRMLLLR
jgi:flagellar hook assembly protein FlgD